MIFVAGGFSMLALVGGLLAYRPFLEPLPLERVWMLLLLPAALAIAIVYKAIKLPRLERMGREVLLLSGQIVFFLALAAAGLWVLMALV